MRRKSSKSGFISGGNCAETSAQDIDTLCNFLCDPGLIVLGHLTETAIGFTDKIDDRRDLRDTRRCRRQYLLIENQVMGKDDNLAARRGLFDQPLGNLAQLPRGNMRCRARAAPPR